MPTSDGPVRIECVKCGMSSVIVMNRGPNSTMMYDCEHCMGLPAGRAKPIPPVLTYVAHGKVLSR